MLANNDEQEMMPEDQIPKLDVDLWFEWIMNLKFQSWTFIYGSNELWINIGKVEFELWICIINKFQDLNRNCKIINSNKIINKFQERETNKKYIEIVK